MNTRVSDCKLKKTSGRMVLPAACCPGSYQLSTFRIQSMLQVARSSPARQGFSVGSEVASNVPPGRRSCRAQGLEFRPALGWSGMLLRQLFFMVASLCSSQDLKIGNALAGCNCVYTGMYTHIYIYKYLTDLYTYVYL